MPAKSLKQLKFMQGVAHGMKPKSGKGPSPEVARKFLEHGSKDYRGEKNGKRV